jgi:hypothetical protein
VYSWVVDRLVVTMNCKDSGGKQKSIANIAENA